MLRSTSIVNLSIFFLQHADEIFFSIGTECSKMVLLGPTELVELRSVQYLLEIRSFINSLRLAKLVPSGTIPIVVRALLCYLPMQFLMSMLPATQYCDGLRGALVIYDPDDVYLSEYVL